MNHWIKRLMYGLIFAVPLVLVTFVFVSAAPPAQTDGIEPLDCKSCHQAFVSAWENGAHAKAIEQVTCESCHGIPTYGHPNSPMVVDKSPFLCGDCHTQALYEWQLSGHGAKNVACSNCHDPHATSLKTDNPVMLCGSCHSERSESFTHTQHSQQGLTCPDCHLQMAEAEKIEGWSYDHTFQVHLETCNKCHAQELHTGLPHGTEAPVNPDAMAAVDAAVTIAPSPVSPLGFSIFAGVIGIGAGIVLAPWLERKLRRLLTMR